MNALPIGLILALLSGASAVAQELCQSYAALPEGDGPTKGMVRLEGGSFTMGDDDERPEERTAHTVTVSPFWIDRHEVTNAQFRAFVEAAGYLTVAESWFFDTDAGVEEIIDRRTGENELPAIAAVRAYLDAQRLYGADDWNGDGVLGFAQHLISGEGQRDGLFWSTAAARNAVSRNLPAP